MYVGDPNDGGLLCTVENAVEGALAEVAEGRASRVSVTLHGDGSLSVEDDGPGLPVAPAPDGRAAAELLLTALRAPQSKFTGLLDLGRACVNFLSEWLWLDIWRGGVAYRQYYERGVPRGPLVACGPTEKTGTRLHFLPDREIFGGAPPLHTGLRLRLQELAYLIPGASITYAAGGAEERFRYPGGIAELVSGVPAPVLPAPLCLRGEADEVSVEVALQWSAQGKSLLYSFANYRYTLREGTHVMGLFDGLAPALLRYAKGAGVVPAGMALLKRDIVRRGLSAAVAVRQRYPMYEGATRHRLVSVSSRHAVSEIVRRELPAALAREPEAAAWLFESFGKTARERVG
jgi:DNA gyrase subunit B